MARMSKEIESEFTPLDAELVAGLAAVEAAFAAVGYPNPALRTLAALAMLEYGKTTRALDRSKWFGALLQVAKVCGGISDDDGIAVDAGEAPGQRSSQMDGTAVFQVDMGGWED